MEFGVGIFNDVLNKNSSDSESIEGETTPKKDPMLQF